jgi:hypothetical protein
MTLLNFGQPVGGIIQVAYTVADIEKAIAIYSQQFKIGPWFVRGPFTPKQALYRGKPTEVSLTLASAFSGHLVVELIQQHNDAPSVYRELIDKRGHGFHHWAVASTAFDRDCDSYLSRGYEIAFSDKTPVGIRVAYFDTTRDLPGMIELTEFNDANERRYTRMYTEAVAWDGADPIRRVG